MPARPPKKLSGGTGSESSSGSTSPGSDKSGVVSCERAGHDKKFTISFLNSRQPVPRRTASTDINNNNCNETNLVKSYLNNHNIKRQLGPSLSHPPLLRQVPAKPGFRTTPTKAAAATKVIPNIG